VAPNRPGRTYDDSVNPLLWHVVETGARVHRLQML
jgi:hypothetical protein